MKKIYLLLLGLIIVSFASATPIIWENVMFDTFDDGSYTNQGWVQGNPTIAEAGGEVGCSASPGCSMYQNFTNISFVNESYQFWAILDQDSTSPPNFNRVGFGRGVDFNFVNDEIVITNDMASNSFNVIGYGACSAISYSESPGNDLVPHNISLIYNVSNNEYRLYRDGSLRTTFTSTCIDYEPHWIHNSRQTTAEMEEFQLLKEAGVAPPVNNTVVVTYPDDGEHFNFYNGSIVLDSVLLTNMTCSLNNSDWVLQNTVPNATNHFRHLNTSNLSEQEYNILANCTFSDLSTDNATINITIDRTFPDITLNSNVNGSVLNSDFTLNITNFDLFLYRANASIIRDSDGLRALYLDSGILSGADMWANLSGLAQISNATYTDGNYTILMQGADTHTTRNWTIHIPEMRRELPNGRNAIDLQLINGIFTIDTPAGTTITTRRSIDRMHFNHSSNTLGIKIMFIEADSIDYLPESSYPGHFIINGQYWFDVEGLDDVSVSQVNGNRWQIRYRQNSEWVESNSLGGLNQRNLTASFTVDKTNPVFLGNITTSTATSGLILYNASEAVNESWNTYTSSCSGSPVSSGTHTPFEVFNSLSIGGLTANTTYFVNVTISDIAGNIANTCFNFTTKATELTLLESTISYTLANDTMDFLCRADEDAGRPVLYGYNITINGVPTFLENLPGNGNVTNFFNSTALNASFAFDDNFNTYANISGTQGVYYNISKFIISSNPRNMTFDIDYQPIAGGQATVWCANDLNNLNSLVNVSTMSTVVRMNETIKIRREVHNGCLNLSNDFVYIFINGTGTGNDLIYEIQDNNLTIDGFVSANSTESVLQIDPNAGVYQMQCFAYNSVEFKGPLLSNVLPFPSVNLRFLDETTNALLNNVTVTVDVIGSTSSVNLSTTTGTINLNVSDVGEVEFTFRTDGYFQNTYFIDFPIPLNDTLDLYLLPESADNAIRYILTTLDEFGKEAVGLKVIRQKFFVSENAYLSVGMARTNVEGKTTHAVQQYDVAYKFLYVDADGNIVKSEAPSPIFEIEDETSVNLEGDPFDGFRIADNVITRIYYTNETGQDYFVFNWFSKTGSLKYACLNVQRITSRSRELYNETCVSSSSGSISILLDPSFQGTYYGQGMIDTNTTNSPTGKDVISKSFKIVASVGQQGAFVTGLTVGMITFLGIFTLVGSMVFMIIGIVIAMSIGLVIGFPLTSLYWVIILVFIIIFLVKRGRRQSQ